jgi:hypothetical protein
MTVIDNAHSSARASRRSVARTAISFALLTVAAVAGCRDAATTGPSAPSPTRNTNAGRFSIRNGAKRADSAIALSVTQPVSQHVRALPKSRASNSRISKDVAVGFESQFTCGISAYTPGTEGIALLAADPLFLGPLDDTGLDALQDAYFAGNQPACGPNVTTSTGYHQQSGIYMDPPGPDLNAGPLHFAFDSPVGSVGKLPRQVDGA